MPTDPLETPEGQRIVSAVADALRGPLWNSDHNFRGDTELAQYAIVALRAALSVTGECPNPDCRHGKLALDVNCTTCHGSGTVLLLVVSGR